MASTSVTPYLRIAGSHTGVGTSEETTLQLPLRTTGALAGAWVLVSFHYVRTDGAGANYQPRLGQSATFTNTDINERMAYSSTAVGTAINDIFAVPIPMFPDTLGRLYFRPGFDAGSDNDGEYEFIFIRGA